MSCGIYKITNTVNNKCYVGQSVNIERRWSYHLLELNRGNHWNPHLQMAWNRYGACAFKFEIICLCSKDKLNVLETYWCDYYRPNVYNIGHTRVEGTMTQEIRKKISEKGKGRIPWNKGKKGIIHITVTPEQCLARSLRLKGHKVSEETKKKISKAHKGKPAWNKGMKGQYTRPKKSEETKQKIRDAVKRNWVQRKGIQA